MPVFLHRFNEKHLSKGNGNTAERASTAARTLDEKKKGRATGAKFSKVFQSSNDCHLGYSGDGNYRGPYVSCAASAGHVPEHPIGSSSRLKEHGCRHRLNAWCGTGGDIPKKQMFGARCVCPLPLIKVTFCRTMTSDR